ncbi:unnamed protein product [Malus baccata var. baccata]
MAELPSFFALKSNHSKKCLRIINQNIGKYQGVVQFSGDDVNSSHARFEVERADGNGELVHIKCTTNGKYLRRGDEREWWIVAAGDEPEEDQSHWTCTLFEPQVVNKDNKAVIRLLHVQLGRYIRLYTANQGAAFLSRTVLPSGVGHFVEEAAANNFHLCLYADEIAPKPENRLVEYTVIDLNPLALPSPFVLKSNSCDKYLSYILDEESQNHEIVQFSGEDPKREQSIFQVEQANSKDHKENHYVHIKCLYNNKYLRRMDVDKQLIMAVADRRDESTKSWGCTLFKPERVGKASKNHNNVLCRLRHVQSGLYTRPFVENRFELRLSDERPDSHGVDVYTAIHGLP